MTNTNAFLPEGHEIPDGTSKYMKFKAGENRFRILASPILGYVWWVDTDGNTKGKTDRIVKGDKPKRVDDLSPHPETAKYFWAMPVWNYQEEAVQILELTQYSVIKVIRLLSLNPKWMSPLDYDIVVTKVGEGMETKYTTNPDPKEELNPEIKSEYEAMSINLNALFEGKDPFADDTEKESVEPVESAKEGEKAKAPANEVISPDDIPF